MNNKTILILFALSALLMINIASAESGSVTVQNTTTKTFVGGVSAPATTVSYTTFLFDVNDYTQVVNYTLTDIAAAPAQFVYGGESDTTSFTITSGGTGNGIVTYSKYLKHVQWIFSQNTIITASEFTVSYANSSFFTTSGVVFNGGSSTSSDTVSSSKPIMLKASNGQGATSSWSGTNGGMQNSALGVSTSATNTYIVTYPLPGYFQINVSKSGQTVQTRDTVYSLTSTYQAETTLNTNNFTYFGVQNDGIYLNVSLSGTLGHTDILINASGCTTCSPPTPAPTATINPATGKGIIFDADSYTVGQTANISWIIDDSIWNLFYSQSIAIKKVGVDDQGILAFTAPKTGSMQYTFTNCAPGNTICGTGTYEVVLYRSLLGFFESSRETDTATVFTPTAYITAPLVVNEGQSITVGYRFGLVTNTGFIIDDKLSEFLLSTGTPIYTNLGCPCSLSPANKTITFVGTGKHRVSLFDASSLNNVASIIITVLPADAVIGQNITSNYFTVDKAVYNFGDIIYGQYQISTSNWSTYPIMLAELTSSSKIPMGTVKLNSQTGGFEIPIDASQINFIQGGIAYVNLSAKSSVFNTTTITLYAIPISINLNKNGWSVAVSKKEVCNGQAFKVDYTSPTGAGIIAVSYFSHGVNKHLDYTFNANGSKNIIIPDATINAGVAIDIQDTNGIYQIGTIVKIVDGGCAVVTTTPSAKTSDQAQTDITNLLQSNIFWALVITVGLMVVVAMETSKYGSNPMIPSVVSGFLGIAAFTIIGWIPSWITFSIIMLVLVVFAWQQAKNINTAGE